MEEKIERIQAHIHFDSSNLANKSNYDKLATSEYEP